MALPAAVVRVLKARLSQCDQQVVLRRLRVGSLQQLPQRRQPRLMRQRLISRRISFTLAAPAAKVLGAYFQCISMPATTL